MKDLQVTIKGITPLLMHDCKGVNSMHPLTKAKKAISAKRKKTEEDTEKLLDLDYLAALYYSDEVGVHVPDRCVEATIRNAAKKSKRGEQTKVGIAVFPMEIPLDYGKTLTQEELVADFNFRDVRPVNIQRSKVLCCRPRFNSWGLTFNLKYDPQIFNKDEILELLDTAGLQVGLCDYRPKYGKFEVLETKELN